MTTTIVDVAALNARQDEIITALYSITLSEVERFDLNQEYDGIVALLVETFGVHASCTRIDPELWSLYSDLFKDRNGFRPRGGVTYSAVKAWMDDDAKRYEAEQGE